jgi:heterogeneous nuclear ribonucleoprotein A1/A3
VSADSVQLEVKRAIPKSEIPTKLRKVFVGGLPLTLSEEEFQEYFAKFGEIEGMSLIL